MLTFPRLFTAAVTLVVQVVRALFRSRSDLVLENLALRQQLLTLKDKRPRPRLDDSDRGFWVTLREAWPRWASRLVVVTPETVVKWHRQRFRQHWTRISSRSRRPGRPKIDFEVRRLIRSMALDNCWGAPRVHGELVKLGFDLCEATVSRYMPRRPSDPDKVQRWITFLQNHREAIAAMVFFTVPTVQLRMLYCFLVIGHARRRVLHFNATFNPTSAWVIQQLREAFPFDAAPRYLIFDRDSTFSAAVVAFVRAIGTTPCRTAFKSPWQNSVAERWIGSCRRELLDHVVVLSERHVVRLVQDYIAYHHDDRTHLGLGKDTPQGRPITPRPSESAKIVALPRVGGLHHRYEWREAA
jgi:putative transposase